MARQLTQTLTKLSLLKSTTTITTATAALLPRTSSANFFSHKAQLVEVDLESSPSPGGEIEVIAGFKLLEDAIHSMIVRRHEPDWLPFRPGSSFWVPPRRPVADNLIQLVGKLTNPLTEEESLSLTSAHGWPSSSYFLDDEVVDSSPVVEVHVCSPKSKNAPLSEDEE